MARLDSCSTSLRARQGQPYLGGLLSVLRRLLNTDLGLHSNNHLLDADSEGDEELLHAGVSAHRPAVLLLSVCLHCEDHLADTILDRVKSWLDRLRKCHVASHFLLLC